MPLFGKEEPQKNQQQVSPTQRLAVNLNRTLRQLAADHVAGKITIPQAANSLYSTLKKDYPPGFSDLPEVILIMDNTSGLGFAEALAFRQINLQVSQKEYFEQESKNSQQEKPIQKFDLYEDPPPQALAKNPLPPAAGATPNGVPRINLSDIRITPSIPKPGTKPVNATIKDSATLIVYCKKNLRGETLELHINGDANNARMANVIERGKQYIATFLQLPPGNHKVFHMNGDRVSKSSQVTVYNGVKSEVDWRGSFRLW